MWIWTVTLGFLGLGIIAAFAGWMAGYVPDDPWGRFIPPLTATYLAAILGIPTGLLVDHWRQVQEEKRRQKIRDERLRSITEQLWKEVNDNLVVLEAYREAIQQGQSYYEFGLNVSSWDTLRHQFAELCSDPGYVRAFSLFYDDLLKLRNLLYLHQDFIIGFRATLSGADAYREHLGKVILGQIHKILDLDARLLKDRKEKFESATQRSKGQRSC